VELEDLEGSILQDVDGKNGKSIFNDGDAMNYDMHNLDDEMLRAQMKMMKT